MVRACKPCSRRRRPTISHRRASVDSICARSAVSSEKVCSWLMDFGPSSAPISVSNQPPASRPCDLPASARPHLPKRCSRKASSRRARSPTLRMPSACRFFSVTLPTPGTLRTSSGARKAASCPGITHSTPLGLAWSELILATRREAAMPMEQFSPVAAFMRSCSRCAARRGGPYRRSVPVMSR